MPQPLTFQEDVRLGEFGFGITNLVARPSPGIDDLKPAEYLAGWKVLEDKIRVHRPEVVALVGVTPLPSHPPADRNRRGQLNIQAAEELEAGSTWPPARVDPRRAGVRPAKSQRSQRKFLVRGDAGRVQGVAEAD